MYTVDSTSVPDTDDHRTRRMLVRALLTVVIVGFATFWIWALFFASKEAVNRIDDRAWAARGEQICFEATEVRLELADLRTIVDAGPEMIRERAEIIDRATDILEEMIDDLVAVTPTDLKGQEIVPLWEADYRIYLQDRRNFADELRETGENRPYYETKVRAIPISEKLATFAGDNEMSTCAPPYDLTR
jgi:hypothetical protein